MRVLCRDSYDGELVLIDTAKAYVSDEFTVVNCGEEMTVHCDGVLVLKVSGTDDEVCIIMSKNACESSLRKLLTNDFVDLTDYYAVFYNPDEYDLETISNICGVVTVGVESTEILDDTED